MVRTYARKLDHADHLPPEMIRALRAYLDFMLIRNYSRWTLSGAEYHVLLFIEWAAERSIETPEQITLSLLESFQRYVYHRPKANGQRLSACAQNSQLVIVRCWTKWLARQNWIASDPGRDMIMPRRPKTLPRAIFTAEEIETLLCQPKLNKITGLRDRAVMETLYSTAMRRSELIGLDLNDLDLERGTVRIRHGKGQKERVVPIGKRAIRWVESYLAKVRPRMLKSAEQQPAVFLTLAGRRFAPSHASDMVRRHVKRAGINKQGSCHLFRHSAATLMMQNGADMRAIQALLGHGDLNATQIYTHVTINQLLEIHKKTHPAKDKPTGADENRSGEDAA